MRRLFYLFSRFSYFFLFVGLCFLSFFLILKNRNNQIYLFSYTSEISGKYYSFNNYWKNYFRLDKINEELVKENIQLRKEMYNSYLKRDTTVYEKEHQLLDLKYDYVYANVLKIIEYKGEKQMIINKGKKQGIDEGMGIITSKGIVGVITNSSDNFSSLKPINHTSISINAKLKKNDYYGFTSAELHGRPILYINDIPKSSGVEIGDTIVTDVKSNIFPEGIPIGIVADFSLSEESGFYHAEINPFEDFNTLNQVLVIRFLYNEELKKLENNVTDINN